MTNSMFSDRRIQKLLSKDINSLRILNRELSISDLLLEIEKYYIKKNYSEEILFKRSSKLKTKFIFQDNVYSGSIGAFIGLIFGFLDVGKSFGNSKGTIEFLIKLFFISLYILIFVVILSVVLTVLTKFNYRKKRMYDNYLNEKEIKIIEKILEGVKELT